MCGGGGGGTGTTKYEWNDAMAPYWGNMLQEGGQLADKPYEQYGGQRIAGLTGDQTDSMNLMRHYIAEPDKFSYGMGNAALQDTVNGKYLRSDPYAERANSYMGEDNQHFKDVLHSGQEDITNAYKQGTAADTTRMFNLAGAFGGSAHLNKMANDEAGLGKTLANYTSGMQNDQYNRSAGLDESWLNRGSNAYQNERGRMTTGIGQTQADQGLTFDRYNKLMGIGDVNRSYNQDILNQGYTDWQAQQQHPYQMADWFSGIMSRAQGGMSGNSTTQMPGYTANPYSQMLGAGLLAYGAMK